MNVLDEIVANKRLEVERAIAARPLASLEEDAKNFKPERRPFRALFDKGGVLIAEIKPRSPSAGQIIMRAPQEIAEWYAKSGADAVSVLTDEKYFGGSLNLLQQVRAVVPQAILRKDFIVEEYQVYETLLSGADAYLLIANTLRVEELSRLIALGKTLGLDALVEVHDEEDVRKALEAKAEIIGINNRDLKTLEVDLATTERLVKLVPQETPAVSESGIESAADVRKVRGWGVRGILTGTAILRSPDPLGKIQELKDALNQEV